MTHQNHERRTAVIINKIKTMVYRTTAFIFATAMLVSDMTVGVMAFSGTDSEKESSYSSQTGVSASLFETDGNLSMNGPVSVTLINRGEVSTTEFFPVECEEFLKYNGIVLSDNDTLNVPRDTIIYDNMVVNVNTVEYVTETETEIVPFDVIETPSQTVPKGTKEITQQGVDGKARRSYISKYVNGVRTERAMYEEVVLEESVPQIEAVGVGGVITAKDGTQYNYTHYKVMEATAYTYIPGLTHTTTATGAKLRKGIVAVDPRVIPMHTRMFITSSLGEYGVGQAEDTGGAIKGNIVDLAFATYDECVQFGRRNVTVYFLEE